jgi:hypothetical protein
LALKTSGFQDKIGTESGPFREKITLEKIMRFRKAVGAGESQAEVAPPTFMTVLRAGEFEMFSQLGIPLSGLLHAEQEYSLSAPIRAGEELEFRTTLVQAAEKRGRSGAMHFLVVETVVSALKPGGPTAVGVSRSTVVYREAP